MEKKRLGVQPQNGIPGFILHFLLEPSYDYLSFEGNGKIPLGRQGKRRGKERAKIKKLQNILLLAVGFKLTTSWLPDGSLNQFCHPDTSESGVEIKNKIALTNAIVCNTNKMAITNFICLIFQKCNVSNMGSQIE